MDELINFKTFPYLMKKLFKNEFKKLRLLCVFGGHGVHGSTIYVTQEDEVYCFGQNDSGCLGLGVTDWFIQSPTLNTMLSNKQLVDIKYGFNYCIALTKDGHLYSWGSNISGQLGNGNTNNLAKPHLIEELSDKGVVQISCGNAHTLALTESGQVYAWGGNGVGELGDMTYTDSYTPNMVPLFDRAESVSCGKRHSLVLMVTGLVYVWGNNRFGQLGQTLTRNSSNRPLFIRSLTKQKITKAVCGPNHTLLLSFIGDIYSFGNNDCGQVGNGSKINQILPIKINDSIKFKDIVTSFKSDISIGISIDDHYYIWGYCRRERILRPQLVSTLDAKSSHDIYCIYAKYNNTYESIVVINNETNISDKTNVVTTEDKLLDSNIKNETEVVSDVSDIEQKEMQMKELANQLLTESGERERLALFLRTRLLEDEWKDRVVIQFKELIKDVVRNVSASTISLETVVSELKPKARQIIPDYIEQELRLKLMNSLQNHCSMNDK